MLLSIKRLNIFATVSVKFFVIESILYLKAIKKRSKPHLLINIQLRNREDCARVRKFSKTEIMDPLFTNIKD